MCINESKNLDFLKSKFSKMIFTKKFIKFTFCWCVSSRFPIFSPFSLILRIPNVCHVCTLLPKICENHAKMPKCQNAKILCEIWNQLFSRILNFPEYELLSYYETAFRTYYDRFVQTVHFSAVVHIWVFMFWFLIVWKLKTQAFLVQRSFHHFWQRPKNIYF